MQFECGAHLHQEQTDPDLLVIYSSWSRLTMDKMHLTGQPSGHTHAAHTLSQSPCPKVWCETDGRTNERTENVLFWGVNKFLVNNGRGHQMEREE